MAFLPPMSAFELESRKQSEAGYKYGVTRCCEQLQRLALEYREHGMWDYYLLATMCAKLLEAKLLGPQSYTVEALYREINEAFEREVRR